MGRTLAAIVALSTVISNPTFSVNPEKNLSYSGQAIKQDSILNQIRKEFDSFPKYPHSDNSITAAIKIDRPEETGKYTITMYGGGAGSAFDGFSIDLGVERLFSGNELDVIEVKPENNVFELTGNSDAFVPTIKTVSITKKHPKFQLFEKLYSKLKELKPYVGNVMKQFVPDAEIPSHLLFYPGINHHSTRLDHEKEIATYVRIHGIAIADSKGNGLQATLEASASIPFKKYQKNEEPPIKYQAAFIDIIKKGKRTESLILNSSRLEVFNSLFNQIEKVYTN